MQRPLTSAADMEKLENFTKFLCFKVAQVIVQGRLGGAVSSECRSKTKAGDWFNLAIADYSDVHQEARSTLTEGIPNLVSSFVVEISLRTSDSESLVLEVWSLSMTNETEDVPACFTVYNRMSLILKSLACISRATPAYKLSRKQGGEYVICYRMYRGTTDITGLGTGFKTLKVGSVGTRAGTLALSVAYRTSENLHVSTKKLVYKGDNRPLKVSHNHFCLPKSTTMSPARPCHTLRSCRMGSKECVSGRRASNSPLESPSYGALPSSFTTSPSEQTTDPYRLKGAMFTIGTPPANNSLAKTPPHTPSTIRRKLSDVSYNREATSSRRQKPVVLSHSERDLSCQQRARYTQKRHSTSAQVETVYARSKTSEEKKSMGNIFKDISMHSTLTNEDSLFRPISCSPCDEARHSRSSSLVANQSQSASSTVVGSLNRSNVDGVTALKSSSPTNAKVGFPDNAELTSHLAHVPPSFNKASLSSTSELKKCHKHTHMPSSGAFVSNSKSAKRAFDSLSEVINSQNLPFEDLISCGSGGAGITEGNVKSISPDASPDDSGGNLSRVIRRSSQSSLSSQESNGSSPQDHASPKQRGLTEEFFMININPAFGRSDSTRDLCAFYREIENVPELVMFQDNNGEETQETLLDLTKQLEDYQRDAVDFDDFVRELRAAS